MTRRRSILLVTFLACFALGGITVLLVYQDRASITDAVIIDILGILAIASFASALLDRRG